MLTALRTLLLRVLPRVLPACCEAGANRAANQKTCFYGGVAGLPERRPNLCGCVWLANVAGLLWSHSGRRAGLQWRCWRIAGLLSGLCQLAGSFDFRLSLNSLASSAPIILTLAMCGPRERYGEFSFGGGETLPAGGAVGAGVAGVGFTVAAGAL